MSRVSVANPFDLLTDENEDRTNVPAPKAKEQKPAAPKATPAQKPAAAKPAATGAAAAKAPAAKPAEQKAAKPAGGEQKPAAAKPAQAGGAAHQGNNVRAPGAPRDANQTLVEREKDYRPSKGVDRRDRPKNVPPRDANKRAFDRKSGTGRDQKEVKRGGQGKGNWGGEIDARETPEGIKEEKAVAGEDEKEEEVKEGEEKAPAAEGEGEKKEEGEKKPEAPPAPEELGLEEYLEKLKKKAPKVEALKPRTVTTDDFAGLTPLRRDEDEQKKAEKKKAEKKVEKKVEEKKSDEFVTDNKLAAELLKFQSHRDSFRAERRGPRRENSDRGDRSDRSDRPPRDNQNRGPRGPRNAQAPAAAAAASPAAAGAEFKKDKDFPALGPHGTSPADQPVAGKA